MKVIRTKDTREWVQWSRSNRFIISDMPTLFTVYIQPNIELASIETNHPCEWVEVDVVVKDYVPDAGKMVAREKAIEQAVEFYKKRYPYCNVPYETWIRRIEQDAVDAAGFAIEYAREKEREIRITTPSCIENGKNVVMNASDFLREYAVYDDVIYNSVDGKVGALSQIMTDYAAYVSKIKEREAFEAGWNGLVHFINSGKTFADCEKYFEAYKAQEVAK